MNWLDVHVLLFLNQFAHRWPWLDFGLTRMYSTTLIGGGTTMAIAWYALFDRNQEDGFCKRSELLLSSILLCGFATLAARALAITLPFRARPMWTPSLHFQLPDGEQLRLLGWSSFPSDHATLFFGLAMGVLSVSRSLGWLAMTWVAVSISLPAIYLGVHWPTDILAGACLGIAFVHIAKIRAVRETVSRLTTKWHAQYPGLFFAILFLWSYEVVNLFEDGRRTARLLWHVLHHRPI